MSRLNYWDDEERELAPRHSKQLAERKERHKVNVVRRMVDDCADRFNDMLSLELSKPLVYA